MTGNEKWTQRTVPIPTVAVDCRHFYDSCLSRGELRHMVFLSPDTCPQPSGRRHGLCQSFARSYQRDRKSTRLNSSHVAISYAVFCLKKKREKKSNCTWVLALFDITLNHFHLHI